MDQRIIQVYNTVTDLTNSGGEDPIVLQGRELKTMTDELDQYTQWLQTCREAYAYAKDVHAGVFGMPEYTAYDGTDEQLGLANKIFWNQGLRKRLFNYRPGLFSKPPTAGDFYQFIASCEVLIDYFTGRIPAQKEEIARLQAHISGHSDSIRRGLSDSVSNADPSPENWTKYPCYCDSTELFLGQIEIPAAPSAVQNLKPLGIVTNDEDSVWLNLPFTYNARSPFSLLISYQGDTHEGEEQLGNMVRSLIYQIVHSMPAYSYEFVFLDPARGGASLREILSGLGNAVDGNAFRLHERLYPDSVYKMLTVAGTKEKVRQELNRLEERISVINSVCGGKPLAQFNAEQFDQNGQIRDDMPGVIPQVFVFYDNTHIMLDSATTDLIQKLAGCSTDAGISLIATSVREKNQTLTKEEMQLLRKGQIRDDLDHLEITPDGYSLYVNARVMDQNANSNLFFNFTPSFRNISQPHFLNLVSESFRPRLTKETIYEKRINLDTVWGKSVATDEIRFPVGINQRDQIAYLDIGGPSGAHGLLAGSTGCGKSSFLHSIITGVIAHYKPTDVQIWLSDYKTAEFRRYMENTPPHITYVGIARSLEYTLSFLDRLYAEYERRLRVFGTCTSVAEYRKLHGEDSMPRILILVDEFHVMSNHVKDFPEYKMKLASLLRETRATGMTFLFADQTCGIGLQGLSEDGKLQLTCRMAMRTTYEEYNSVFNISNSKDVIPTQDKFEVLLQRTVSRVDSLGKSVNRIHYEHCKTLFAKPELRDEIARRSIEAYGPGNAYCVEEAGRTSANWNMISQDMAGNNAHGIPVYMGVPVTLKKFFSFQLIPNYAQNVVVTSPNEPMLSSMMLTQIENMLRQEDFEIYVIANEYDSLYSMCRKWLHNLEDRNSRVHIVTYIGDICQTIVDLHDTMTRRRTMRNYNGKAVFWLGLYDISKDMGYLSSTRPAKYSQPKKAAPAKAPSVNDLEAQFLALFGEAPVSTPAVEPDIPDEEEDCGFNATGEISELMDEGAKRGIYSFCYYSSVNIALKTKCAPISGTKSCFTHKIASGIGKEESLDYFGASKLSVDAEGKPLDDKTAVYYNGSISTQFKPFIAEVESQIVKSVSEV